MNERPNSSSRTENLLKHGIPTFIALGGVAYLGISYTADTLAKNTTECIPANEQVTVQSGDSIWEIAKTYAPDTDTRDIVQNIVQDNPGVVDHAGKIHPGNTLSVEVCLPDSKTK